MNKSLLIKYIDGKCQTAESRKVVEWIESDEKNRLYFEELRSLIVRSKLASYDAILQPVAIKGHSRWKRIAAVSVGVAASIALVAMLVLNLSLKNDLIAAREQKVESIKILDGATLRDMRKIVYHTEKGVKGKVVLPDGSNVVLSSDSRLEIPEVFSGRYREVGFSGEAFFDVVPNKDFPMIVNTENGIIEVLGTQFNLRSYSDDGATSATLINGKIKIKSNENPYGDNYIMELNPNETAILRNNVAIKCIANADTTKVLAWKEGILIFDSTPMTKVIKELERWHGCEFVIRDSSVFNYSITAKFESRTINDIMEMIRFCTPVCYQKVDDTIYLSAGK